MKLIQENPYRIAGLLSNTTEKELLRQKSKIKRFNEIGKAISSEYDFPFLNPVIRNEEKINKAFSDIEQNQNRVNHSLFWFINSNPIDNTAIHHLIRGNKEKALDIWEKVTKNKEVSSRNFSAFNNLGTLYLLDNSKDKLKRGIISKIELLESEYFKDYAQTIADETFTIDGNKQIQIFIDGILSEFNNRYSTTQIVDLFSNCNGTALEYITNKFTEEPIHNIERKVEYVKKKRINNKPDSLRYGNSLYTDTLQDLILLKTLLGSSNIQYNLLADKVAKEILQCSIDYFNNSQAQGSDEDYLRGAMKLAKLAQEIAVNPITKSRVTDSIKVLEKMEEERIQTDKIKDDLDSIASRLENFGNEPRSITNAQKLVLACTSNLRNIDSILGSHNELYLSVSSAVVNNALGMIIEVVNDAQSGLEYNKAKALLLPKILTKAIAVIYTIELYDMDLQTRNRFNDNKNTILEIKSKLDLVRNTTKPSGAPNYISDGCYIATMVYGNYDHPQVIKLRKYRDNVLKNKFLGRQFIKAYYYTSPNIVKRLHDKDTINRLIRCLLDRFIKIIKE